MKFSSRALGAWFVAFGVMISGCAVEPEPVEDQVIEVVEEEITEPDVSRHPLTGVETGPTSSGIAVWKTAR